MNQLPAEDTITRAKREIRMDAELARQRAGELKLPVARRPSRQPREPIALRDSFTIGELCQADYTAFLDQAYQALLRRKPDPAGYEAQARLLASGRSKIEILGDIRWSAEGRDVGVHVPLLWPRYVLAKVMRIPVLGYMIEWVLSLLSLPRIVRHERASDVYQSARRKELMEQTQAMARQIDANARELGKLANEKSELEATLQQLHQHAFGQIESSRADGDLMDAETTELRQRVLSIDHFLGQIESLRANQDLMDAETKELRQRVISIDHFLGQVESLRANQDLMVAETTELRDRVLGMDHVIGQIESMRANQDLMAAESKELRDRVLGMDHVIGQIESLRTNQDLMSAETMELRQRVLSVDHVLGQFQSLRTSQDLVSANHVLMCAETAELRQRVLGMNHWQASLRSNLAALQLAESGRQRESSLFNADVAKRVLGSDPFLSSRLDLWSGRLAANLPHPAQVLDLCSGEDWLKRLLERGLDATSVSSNLEYGQQASELRHAVIDAEPEVVLARCADQSLHGLTALDVGFLLRRIPVLQLLDDARRVLRPDGWVLFGFRSGAASIADRLEGRPDVQIDFALMAQAMGVAGFAEVEAVGSDDGVICVLGRAASSP